MDCQIRLPIWPAQGAYSCFGAWESIGYSLAGCFDFSQFQKEIGKGKGRCVESPLEFMEREHWRALVESVAFVATGFVPQPCPT